MMEADLDRDGKISFEEFTKMVENTDVSMSMTLGTLLYSLNSALRVWNAVGASIPRNCLWSPIINCSPGEGFRVQY